MNDTYPPKPRWYHLTPDRCVIGLLLVVGVLSLSEWFCWFPFNEQKGWTVLIALGTVCVAVLLLLSLFIVALVFRRRFQFSIRSLLVFMLLCAVVCSWFAVRMNEAKGQREAVAAIRARGVYVEYPESSAPAWLVNSLGVEFFEGISFADCPFAFDDEDMVYLSGLANLEVLYLVRTQVTDSGLEHLKGLANLQALSLSGTQVTDSGLEHLKGLANLRWLNLSGTQVTDSGLEHLKGLAKLQFLDLLGTQVTDSGLEHLKGLADLQRLYLSYTQVTDSGLERLKGLANLQGLDLGGTRVSDSGLDHLKGLANLQGLYLRGTQVSDSGLEHLKGLATLQLLDLRGTQVTKEGVNKLQQVLPGCEIDH
jgi:hypothetical protein